MPLYAYICRNCGYEFDTIQPSGARDFSTCPQCFCYAEKKLSVFDFSFGFTLSDESRFVRGHKDEFVRNI